MTTSLEIKVQKIGRFLSNMIMPNISAFIAWGVISTLFLPSGWIPNKNCEQLINLMIIYLLPILVGYTGGKLVGGDRGAVVGSIATVGLILSSSMPMLFGAMLIGPLGGWIINLFDKIIQNKIYSGFEMLVNNFSSGIISTILLLLSFFYFGPFVNYISYLLSCIITKMIENNLLPLTAIFVEPAKILFLNNAINHGIFSPLGIQEVVKNHKSVFFFIESNPGPGIGVLVAWLFLGPEKIKNSIKSAIFVQFLGGVHEIYFPYVLIKPKLIFSVILGGMTGIYVLIVCHGGLVSTVSPGSIISILAMTPKNNYFVNIISIFLSFLVSFFSAFIILKINHNNKNNNFLLKDMHDKTCHSRLSYYSYIQNEFSNHTKLIKNIVFACDAGMGSSAIGVGILKRKLSRVNLDNILVCNLAINLLSKKNIDLVITHYKLTDRARLQKPNLKHISIKNFLDHDFYNDLVKFLINHNKKFINNQIEKSIILNEKSQKLFTISKKNIFIGQKASSKIEVIKFIGSQLIKQGYVNSEYVDAMLEREKISPTWIGQSIALPHGTLKSKDSILRTGMIFCQYPQGIVFGDNIEDVAYIVIGIAAKNNEHMQLVNNITNILDDEKIIKKLSHTNKIKDILNIFK
ncbi:PTS system mannitol-specific EIICBA component [Buchnera aphidicola (Eriosoma grossulariae)]|uniref:PTS mannitol transporter subunit IICBA n=1 Tax=Buchnera aphidicola TaxID=9 RepID=UPI0034641D6D